MNTRNRIETISTHIRFPAQLREWLDRHAAAEGYASTQDLIMEVCRDYKRLMEGTPSRYVSAAYDLKRKARDGNADRSQG
jgi:hypothetical protein